MGCAQGTGGQLLLDSDSTFDTSSEGFEFKTETFRLTETVSGGDFIRGFVGRFDNQKRVMRKEVKGGFTTYVSPIYVSRLYGRALGDASSPFTPSNSATAFYAQVYRVANAQNYKYNSLVISDITISGREGELLELAVNCLGVSETTNTDAVPAVTYGSTVAYQPMHFSDLSVFTIGGATMSVKAFELKITNRLEPKFYNSLTATDICVADRVIDFSATMSYADEYAIYPQAGSTAAAVVVAAANAGCSISFTMPSVRPTAESPTISGRNDIDIVWKGQAGASTTGGDEISVAVDTSP